MLRIEPITDPSEFDDDFSVLDEAGDEVAVVTGKSLALKMAAAPELLDSLKHLIGYVDPGMSSVMRDRLAQGEKAIDRAEGRL